jgi:acyl-coenzyme A synthetase/AMP-(fatty) acid ligase
MVKVGGISYYAEDIEGSCEELPEVASGGCVAVDLAQVGEREGLALIVEKRSSGSDLDGLVRSCIREGFGIEPRIVRIEARGAIPRTTSGKRMRWACGELLN